MTAELPNYYNAAHLWQQVNDDLTEIMELSVSTRERISAIRSTPLSGNLSTDSIYSVLPLICMIIDLICQYLYPI